jgi:hypothetical protein
MMHIQNPSVSGADERCDRIGIYLAAEQYRSKGVF